MSTQKLDRQFLESLINQRITSLKFSQGSKKGDGVAGSLKTISLETESGEKHTIIVKLNPEDPAMVSYMVNCRILEIEGEFYGSILKDLQDSYRLHGLDPDSLPFPKHYGHSEVFLALEDLRPLGYRMADKYQGLSLPETVLTLSKLAEFHAATYNFIRENGEKIFKKSELTKCLLEFIWDRKELGESFLKTPDMLEKLLPILKEQNQMLGEKLEKLLPDFCTLFKGTFSKTDSVYFPVICHGDFWLNNILFKYADDPADPEQPTDIKFIDMQQVHRGNIFVDLMYFFFTSTTPAFRAKHLHSCLHTYHDSFVEALAKLECPTPVGFTRGFLLNHYYLNLKSIAVFAGGAIAFQLGNMPPESDAAPSEENGSNGKNDDGESPEGEEEIILTRYKPEDLPSPDNGYDTLGIFCEMQMKGDPRAVQRFVDVIQELHDLGVLD